MIDFDNEEEKKTETKIETEQKPFILKIYNKSMENRDLCVSFPFVIKIQCKKLLIESDIFKNKIATIIGIHILNENGYMTIKNEANIALEMTQINIKDNVSDLILYWKTDLIKHIDNIWSGDICKYKLRDLLVVQNCKWINYLFDIKTSDTIYYSIKDEITNVRNNLKLNMDNPRFADVKFEIGKKNSAHKTFYGISALFAVQSKVFEAQFFGSMLESHRFSDGDIRLCLIDDICPDTFEFLREYFYNLYPSLNSFNAVEIVYASTKYLLPDLQYPCSKFIHSLYDKNNNNDTNDANIYTCLPLMVQLYEIGFHDMSISLLNKSLYLYKNAYNAMQQNGFLSLPLHILKVLVSCDEFGAQEFHIYTKIVEWAQFQIQKYGPNNIKNIIISENEESKNENENENSKEMSVMGQLMNEFKYLIRWTLIPLKYYKENKCGQYCLNKNELQLIYDLLASPSKYLLQNNYFQFYNTFNCFYRDYNKYLSDEKCISYPYYNNLSENDIILQFIYVDTDYNNPNINRSLKSPTFYGCKMNKFAIINDFRKYCAHRFKVINNDYENIFVCLILQGKVFHVFNISENITELNTEKYLICVYYSPLINIRNIKVKMDDEESDDNKSDEFEYENEAFSDDETYPYCEKIDGWNYRWGYQDEIKQENETNETNEKIKIKLKKKKQHLLSIVHTNIEHKENLKPLCGIPLLLNLFCESKLNLFTLQKHFLSKIAKIIIDDQLYASIKNSDVHSIKFIDEVLKKYYFNIIVRRNFIHYNALDHESLLKFNKNEKKIDTQNLLCLEFKNEQMHNWKKSFTYSIKYCKKHISVPYTSKQWKLNKDYTEKKMIRVFRTKDTMKLKSKIT